MKDYIRQIIDCEGIEIISEKRLIYFLDDLGAFQNVPRAYRSIFLSIVENGYASKLYNLGKWGVDAKTLCHRFVDNYGVKDEYAIDIFNLFCYGFGWECEISILDSDDKDENQKDDDSNIVCDYQINQYINDRFSFFEANPGTIKNPRINIVSSNPFNLELTFDLVRSLGIEWEILYIITGKDGEILEKESVVLANSRSIHRTISDVGKNLNWKNIESVGCIIREVLTNQTRSESYSTPLSDANDVNPYISSKKSPIKSSIITDSYKISTIYRRDKDKCETEDVGIQNFMFEYASSINNLRLLFVIPPYTNTTRLQLCYELYDVNNVEVIFMKKKLAQMLSSGGVWVIDDIFNGISPKFISRIEFYLRKN